MGNLIGSPFHVWLGCRFGQNGNYFASVLSLGRLCSLPSVLVVPCLLASSPPSLPALMMLLIQVKAFRLLPLIQLWSEDRVDGLSSAGRKHIRQHQSGPCTKIGILIRHALRSVSSKPREKTNDHLVPRMVAHALDLETGVDASATAGRCPTQ